MLYSIENNQLICTIESIGAEIRSLKRKESGEEYIWQINPSIWGSSSPLLFPAIGNIKKDKVTHEGEEYAMIKHGIIRNNENLEFSQISNNRCSFSLKSSKETQKNYPFNFIFSVVYELIENRLVMTYNITNEDDETLYFACGGHTAYSLPLDTSTHLSDYVVEFPNQSVLEADTLGDSGLLSYRKRTYELVNNALELNDSIFDEDALVFTNIDFDWVRLRKKNRQKGIVVRFLGYPNLALWAKPGADYICIEPWLGLPDREDESTELSEKVTYQKLEPLEKFSIAIETVIE